MGFKELNSKKKKIFLSDAAKNGIKGVTKETLRDYDPKYKRAVEKANRQIATNKHHEAKAAVKGRQFIVQDEKIEGEPDSTIISQRHNARRDAEIRDDEKKKKIWETVRNLKEAEKQEKNNDQERKKFIKMIIDKTDDAQKKNYQEQNEKQESKTNNIQTKNEKKEYDKKISGTSLNDLLNSQEFKEMYENTIEDDGER